MLTLDQTAPTTSDVVTVAVIPFGCPVSENLHCPMTNSETCPGDPKVQWPCVAHQRST